MTEEFVLQPQQEEMPFAIVMGTRVTAPPKDLYIPPDALEIILEAFEGPLDLLLYLIKRQNLDILDIPIARITEQYMTYIDMMEGMKLELAAEYLVMAAMLAEIKSRMLLPRPLGMVKDSTMTRPAHDCRLLKQKLRPASASATLSRSTRPAKMSENPRTRYSQPSVR